MLQSYPLYAVRFFYLVRSSCRNDFQMSNLFKLICHLFSAAATTSRVRTERLQTALPVPSLFLFLCSALLLAVIAAYASVHGSLPDFHGIRGRMWIKMIHLLTKLICSVRQLTNRIQAFPTIHRNISNFVSMKQTN